MSPEEVLTLQALKLKALHTRGTSDPASPHSLLESIIERASEDETPDLRNICAKVSVQLFEKVEQLCSLLDLSKRQVVEMALVDFVAKADLVVARVDPLSEQE